MRDEVAVLTTPMVGVDSDEDGRAGINCKQRAKKDKGVVSGAEQGEQHHQALGDGVSKVDTVGKKRWVDLFAKNRIYDAEMTLHEVRQEGKKVVLNKEDAEAIEETMGFYLVGRFLGRFPRWKTENK